ncbi:MAG: RIP metalloprotease RseP [Acidobacteria bacterium]|nr:RIP metalloprotease RseP [Acidobacteriota bacterium]MDW7983605.1 RIP metalloprotease RseP [Acidobacteriota bacterium]
MAEWLDRLWGILVYVVGFVIMFGILVFFHELGHFLVAKALRFRVEVFSLGFGPRVWGWRRRGTDYRISAVPLGGYVRVAGMDPSETGGQSDPRIFYNRPLWQQMAVVVAGGLINLALGPLCFMTAYRIGFQEPAFLNRPPALGWVYPDSPAARAGLRIGDRVRRVNDRLVTTWREAHRAIFIENLRPEVDLEVDRDGSVFRVRLQGLLDARGGAFFYGIAPLPPVVVDRVEAGSPAAQADLRPGDVIYQIDDDPVESLSQVQDRIQRSQGRSMVFHVYRQGTFRSVTLQPVWDAQLRRLRVGVALRPPATEYQRTRLSWGEAWRRGWHDTFWTIGLIFRALRNLVTGELSIKTLSGPILIAQAAGQALLIGWARFFQLMGLFTINLGIFNLLPIPALDGGHAAMILLSALVRALTGRPLSPRVREWVAIIGMVLLLGLTLLVLTLDVLKLRG